MHIFPLEFMYSCLVAVVRVRFFKILPVREMESSTI